MDEPALADLDRESYISLATFRRSGVAVPTPVWFAAHRGRLYVFTEARSGKVKRLRNDPRVRVAPCGARGGLRGEWFEGRARIVDDVALEAEAYTSLRAKYGLLMRLTDFFSRLTGRIEGRAILEIEV